MSDTKLNKAYEVALICAAQDGLEPEEVMSMADSVMTTPMLTMMMGQFFNEEELEDYDLMGAVEGMGEITKMLETGSRASRPNARSAHRHPGPSRACGPCRPP